jgi:hypothetical protein
MWGMFGVGVLLQMNTRPCWGDTGHDTGHDQQPNCKNQVSEPQAVDVLLDVSLVRKLTINIAAGGYRSAGVELHKVP